jgi:hypothetical protein
MSRLFFGASSFNDDISAWDTSGVKRMDSMFYGAHSFNQDIGDWAVDSVTSMENMFRSASAFNQDLGWCVDDGVDLSYAFHNTACAAASCGVEQVDGTCSPSPAPTMTPTMTPAPTPAPTRAPPHSPALLIFFILMPFLIFLSCICSILAGESGKVAPTAVDAVPATSEELAPTAVDAAPATSAAPPTAEEQAPAALMGTVVAVHEGEYLVPYATVLSIEQ